MPSAEIYYQEIKAGLLSKTRDEFSFQYTSDYLARPGARPISLSLPLQEETFTSETFFPFFEGLLTEGWLDEVTRRTLKIDAADRFGLLLQIAQDPIGAVSVRRVEEAHDEG